MITRRDFLKIGATAATVVTIPRPLLAHLGNTPELVPPIGDPRLKELAFKALDAARSAGALYADARLTHDRVRTISPDGAGDAEGMAFGVRALVNGYWGFASGPVWSQDEAARLGREAVHQGKINALGKPRAVDLAPVVRVPDGQWVMPVKIDPFTVHPQEVRDFLKGLQIFTERTPRVSVGDNKCTFFQQEKAFASTDGSYCTQRLVRSEGSFVVTLAKNGKEGQGSLDSLSPAGAGWELYRAQPLRERIQKLLAMIEEDLALPIKPVDVGRYDVAFDAFSVANLLDVTLGRATELDRALGYEANASGTSYISAPLEVLGSYQAGAPSLTVTANRSEPGGCATVRWDDEGVVPDDFTLVKDGVLTDFQTTRESAGWLKSWYAQHGRPFRSHGCANADSGINAPLQHVPNLVLAPGTEAMDFDGLVGRLANGIAIKGVQLDMDFQNLNGLGTGTTYEVKRGKRTALIGGAGMLFRAPELWKGLLALAGAGSVRRYGSASAKGQPGQATYHSVTAPAAAFKQLTVIDPMRKA
jgi:TldD protein